MRKCFLYTLLISSFLSFSCSNEHQKAPVSSDPIEILLRINDFTETDGTDGKVRMGKHPGSDKERGVTNLYIFLFNSSGTDPQKYYIEEASFSGGVWNRPEMKVQLDMTSIQAGSRRVYVIANIAPSVKNSLDAVDTEEALIAVKNTTNQPWSPDVGFPLLMSGFKVHDFLSNRLLKDLVLTRCIAKVDFEIELTDKTRESLQKPVFDNKKLSNFKYRYVDFDKDTYIVKPTLLKPDNLTSSISEAWPQISNWMSWESSLNDLIAPDTGMGYQMNSEGSIVSLRIITYLNERDTKGAAIEFVLPWVDGGMLPPPEFGPMLYRLPLADKIVRNNWYKYKIRI